MDVRDELERGRDAYRRRAWADAYRLLELAAGHAELSGEDLERLAVTSYLLQTADDVLPAYEKAHRAYTNVGDEAGAARCGFWLSLFLLLRGDANQASGWLTRSERLLGTRDCVERGYLRIPNAQQRLFQGDHEGALALAAGARELGERFGDADLVACAGHLQGRILIQRGDVADGLGLLDEAMVSVVSGELSPVMTGMVYCSVIEACQQVHAVGRAREWTGALARWCAEQPDLVAFTATCLVARAEVLQLRGAWPDAIEEARRACMRAKPPASAFYRQAEVHRLRGEFGAAEEGYRQTSRAGREPQPGLALLRLAQGRPAEAEAAIRRVMSVTTASLARSRILPAFVEIMVAVGDLESARGACRELEGLAEEFDIGVLGAMAAAARGAVQLAEGDARAALVSLREAGSTWQQVEAPYAEARVRELAGNACRALGDHDGAQLEWEAAAATFETLGAAPDRARLGEYARLSPGDRAHGLTPRELEVLRLVAAGDTNRAVAEALSISEKTVARHLSNIFAKLGVTSRAAATAYAFRNAIV